MKIQEAMEILNGYFNKYSEKGECDFFYDAYGIDPQGFRYLSMKRKKELVKEFIKAFHTFLKADFNTIQSCYFGTTELCLIDLEEIGEVASTLIALCTHYELEVNVENPE